MKPNDTEIERMMNFYLDGQLAPEKRKQFEQLLADDAEVRRDFDRLRQTDLRIEQTAAAMTAEPDDSFEMIYSQARDSYFIESQPRQKRRFNLRFVAGLAAGVAIGLLVNFMMTSSATSPDSSSDPTQHIAAEPGQTPDNTVPVLQAMSPQKETPSVHEVDLYYFKDKQGQEWLVEGIRHEMVQQASSGSI